MAEHKKALSEAASFFVWSPSSLGLKGASSPFLVGPARRNRWHFSGSLLVPKENNPRPAASTLKSPCPCRAKHAAFASQTGLRLKSPTGAFMPSGHRRPFWFSFGAKREQSPPGCSASKSPCPCRAEHAAFALQTGLRLKSPTGAFMPSGHRRPFWFSFVRQKRTSPPCEAPPKMHPFCKSKMQAFCVSAQKNCIFIFCPETLQKALTTAFPHAILNT